MSTTKLTKTQRLLLYGLKTFNVEMEDAVGLVAFMTEDNQLLLIHYMKTHPEATAQEIMNVAGDIIRDLQKE